MTDYLFRAEELFFHLLRPRRDEKCTHFDDCFPTKIIPHPRLAQWEKAPLMNQKLSPMEKSFSQTDVFIFVLLFVYPEDVQEYLSVSIFCLQSLS